MISTVYYSTHFFFTIHGFNNDCPLYLSISCMFTSSTKGSGSTSLSIFHLLPPTVIHPLFQALLRSHQLSQNFQRMLLPSGCHSINPPPLMSPVSFVLSLCLVSMLIVQGIGLSPLPQLTPIIFPVPHFTSQKVPFYCCISLCPSYTSIFLIYPPFISYLQTCSSPRRPLFYTRSHLSALQNCALIFSTNFQFIFTLKQCTTQFIHLILLCTKNNPKF